MLDVPQNHISVPIEPKSGEIDPLKNNEEKIGRSSPGLDEKKSSMAQKSTMWKKKEEDKVEKKNDESPDDYKIPTYKIMWYKFKVNYNLFYLFFISYCIAFIIYFI